MGNLSLRRKRKLSPFRRIALGTWRTSGDPSVYGALTLRMEEALRYRDAFRAATGKRLTLTHMMAQAVGAVLEDMPDANAILRWGQIYLREDIAVFLQVVKEDPNTGQVDLSGATVKTPEKKSLADIVDEVENATRRVKTHEKTELEVSRGMLRRVPPPLVGALLKAIGFASYTLNLDLRRFGLPRDAFGSVMITNIGSLGLSEAFAPLVPYSRVPMVVAMGAVHDGPVVEDGRVVPAKLMRVCATFDHRILDGAHAARMVAPLRRWMEQPFEHFDPLPDADADAGAGAG